MRVHERDEFEHVGALCFAQTWITGPPTSSSGRSHTICASSGKCVQARLAHRQRRDAEQQHEFARCEQLATASSMGSPACGTAKNGATSRG
jgi:hypothetical protein